MNDRIRRAQIAQRLGVSNTVAESASDKPAEEEKVDIHSQEHEPFGYQGMHLPSPLPSSPVRKMSRSCSEESSYEDEEIFILEL
jgi:hypothetical protein